MSKGKINDYDHSRGYGHIIDSESGQKLLFYVNYIQLKVGETLHVGQDVEYDVQKVNNDTWTTNIKLCNPA